MAPLMWFERVLVAFMTFLCIAFEARCEPTDDYRKGRKRPLQDFGQ